MREANIFYALPKLFDCLDRGNEIGIGADKDRGIAVILHCLQNDINRQFDVHTLLPIVARLLHHVAPEDLKPLSRRLEMREEPLLVRNERLALRIVWTLTDHAGIVDAFDDEASLSEPLRELSIIEKEER